MRTKCGFAKTLVLVLFSMLSFKVFAQDWYDGKPIKKVNFVGLVNVKETDLEGITAAYINKNFTNDLFSELYSKLDELEYFENISPVALPGDKEKNTVILEFTVEERNFISRIEFVGNNGIRNGELKDTIQIKEKDIANQSKVLSDARAIRDLYLSKGYTNVKVSQEMRESESGIIVIFKIEEGQESVVTSIEFEGNAVVASKTLKKRLSLKEAKGFTKGAFQESSLETDKQNLLAYYQNQGYIDAVVLNVVKKSTYNAEKNRDEISLTFVIREGSQYTFGGITFNGNTVFKDSELQSFVKLQTGKPFSSARFMESMQGIYDHYYENGYTQNQFTPRENKNSDTKVISYELIIQENARSHLEGIIIKGNQRTKEYVIRRELPMETGDIFSKTKVMTGLRNLYNLQFFSSVIPNIVAGSEENLVNLVIDVEEQSTTSLEFGLTFSGVTDPDDLPVSLYAKWQDSNLFGEGKSVSASTTLATEEQSISLGYGQSWLFGLPVSTSASFEFSHSTNTALRNRFMPDGSLNDDEYYMEYEQYRFSLGASLGHRWTPDFAILTLSGGISGSLIDNIYDASVYSPVDYSISLYNNNWAPKNCIWTSFSMDGRDVNFDPTKGWFLSDRLAWYGLLPAGFLAFAPQWGETEFYLRSDLKAEQYFTLFNWNVTDSYSLKMVLMLYSQLSLQLPIPGTTIGDTNKLYIDGMFTGRGWSIYNRIRGKTTWSNTVELRIPLIQNAISFDLFMDAATIKTDFNDFFNDFTDKDDWYFSFGPGIRFSIPQFPLRLLLTNTFKLGDTDGQWTNRYNNGKNNWYENWNFVLSFNLTNK